jgi:hypothetical protein
MRRFSLKIGDARRSNTESASAEAGGEGGGGGGGGGGGEDFGGRFRASAEFTIADDGVKL